MLKDTSRRGPAVRSSLRPLNLRRGTVAPDPTLSLVRPLDLRRVYEAPFLERRSGKVLSERRLGCRDRSPAVTGPESSE